MNGWLYALGGAFAGAAQAGILARSVRRVPGASSYLIRMTLVAIVLLLAARAGHLMLGATGWLIGFAASVATIHWRLR